MQGIKTLEQVAKEHVVSVLDQLNGNVAKAARALDIDRVTLHRKLKRWGIDRMPGEFVERVGEAR